MCMSCARSGGGVISRAKVRSVQLTLVIRTNTFLPFQLYHALLTKTIHILLSTINDKHVNNNQIYS